MNNILEQLSLIGIIPVIAINDKEDAVPLANALEAGGISAAEVTFRTDAAEESIREIAQNCPNVIVGAGTILNTEQCERAINAGASFIVSPGYNDEVVSLCISKNMPIIPGCVNPSEITKAVNAGLDMVKFFPAGVSGGLEYIKNVAPVFPKLKFMPTGGINPSNLNSYLEYPKIACCGGSWMVKADLIKEKQFDKITQMCKDAVSKMLDFRFGHMAINAGTSEKADEISKKFLELFGLEKNEKSSSIFSSPSIEVMKEANRGANGHIAITTVSLPRAIAHLTAKGVEFDYESATYNDKNEMVLIYTNVTLGGFDIHLQKA